MRKLLLLFLLPFLSISLFAQNTFEGTINVFYTNEKNNNVVCEIKVKGNDVYLKQNEYGNPKYDRFVINLQSRELYTISTAGRKVIIKYNLDSLLSFYDANHIKDGFTLHPNYNFKSSDKVKKDNGIAMTKYTGETETSKATIWVGESGAPVNAFIPFLRLLGNWNDADGSFKGEILETEVSSKISKKDSKVLVTLRSEPVAKEMFLLPKTYLQKDFAKLMTEERNNSLLKTIVQTFAEF